MFLLYNQYTLSSSSGGLQPERITILRSLSLPMHYINQFTWNLTQRYATIINRQQSVWCHPWLWSWSWPAFYTYLMFHRNNCVSAVKRVLFYYHQVSVFAFSCMLQSITLRVGVKILCQTIEQGPGTYGSQTRCGSFHDAIWLAWYFHNDCYEWNFFFLQTHQQHHAAPEVTLTVRSMVRCAATKRL